MPKHSLLALIGFAESAVTAVNGHRDKIAAAGSSVANGIKALDQLRNQVVATDGEVKALRIQLGKKAAELRRLKRQLYDDTSNLVDIGASSCGKQTPEGRAIAAVRKKLRPRRSPNTAPPKTNK